MRLVSSILCIALSLFLIKILQTPITSGRLAWKVSGAECRSKPAEILARYLQCYRQCYTAACRERPKTVRLVASLDRARISFTRSPRRLTCGLFFSLGHSTIVIAVTLAVAISISVATKLDPVSSVGGIVGISVSASFLFLLAIINSVILYKILRDRRRAEVYFVL